MFPEKEANAFITPENLILLNQVSSLTESYINSVTKTKPFLRNGAKDKASLLSERVAFEQNPDGNVTSNFLSSVQVALTNFRVIKLEYYSPINERSNNESAG